MKANTKVVVQLRQAMMGVTVNLGDRAFIVEQIYSMLLRDKSEATTTTLPVRETNEQKGVRVTSGQLVGIKH